MKLLGYTVCILWRFHPGFFKIRGNSLLQRKTDSCRALPPPPKKNKVMYRNTLLYFHQQVFSILPEHVWQMFSNPIHLAICGELDPNLGNTAAYANQFG